MNEKAFFDAVIRLKHPENHLTLGNAQCFVGEANYDRDVKLTVFSFLRTMTHLIHLTVPSRTKNENLCATNRTKNLATYEMERRDAQPK